MTSTASQKVTPITDQMEARAGITNEDKPPVEEEKLILGLNDLAPRESASREMEQEEQADQLKFLLKQVAINKRIERMRNMMTYNYIKSTMQWFLEAATCRISISVRIIPTQLIVRTFNARLKLFILRQSP